MKNNTNQYWLLMIISMVLISVTCFGQVRLPKLISDGMVLQRDGYGAGLPQVKILQSISWERPTAL